MSTVKKTNAVRKETSGALVEGMAIANPIYDVVFKSLMTAKNEHARFFVETIIGEQVKKIDFVPQEYTYFRKVKSKGPINLNDYEKTSVMRLDFVATICTQAGEHKKVLIEIQKSHKPTDLVRFRNYLGKQYQQQDMVEVKSGRVEKAIPIIVIYMLGFHLPKIKAIAVKASRTYIDMINGEALKQKSTFIESLTHDGYFLQLPRIIQVCYENWKDCSPLEKLLSLFEQNYFTGEHNFCKKYPYLTKDDDNLKEMVTTLVYLAADEKVRRAMEEERWDYLNEIEYERMIKEQGKALEEQGKALEEKDKMIEEKDKALEEERKALEDERKALEEERKANDELRKQLEALQK